MKKTSLVILLSLLVIAFGSANAGYTVDHVTQLQGVDTIHCGVDVELHLRWTNDAGAAVSSSSNGFVLHDNGTGAVWTYVDSGAIWVESINWDTLFDGGKFINRFPDPLSGTGEDTIGFGAFRLFKNGVPDGFDSVFAVISIHVDCAYTGDTICLDSSWYAPSNPWKWSAVGDPNFIPSWDGPHCYTIGSQGTDIGDPENTLLPTVFALEQNYPNPFNPATNISFDVPFKSHVKISVYNILGQRVAVPLDREMVAGSHKVEWDAAKEGVSSGVYFFKMEAGDFVKTRKMMLLK